MAEVFTIFFATLLGWDVLQPVHLLWINLVTDTLPAIALGVEPAEPGVMTHKPRGRQSNFFDGGVFGAILIKVSSKPCSFLVSMAGQFSSQSIKFKLKSTQMPLPWPLQLLVWSNCSMPLTSSLCTNQSLRLDSSITRPLTGQSQLPLSSWWWQFWFQDLTTSSTFHTWDWLNG